MSSFASKQLAELVFFALQRRLGATDKVCPEVPEQTHMGNFGVKG